MVKSSVITAILSSENMIQRNAQSVLDNLIITLINIRSETAAIHRIIAFWYRNRYSDFPNIILSIP